MKISKVDHRRTAVAVTTKEQRAAGILYNVPVKNEKAVLSTRSVVEEAVRKSTRLYSPFNSAKIEAGSKNIVRDITTLKQCYMRFVKTYVTEDALNKKTLRFVPSNRYYQDKQIRMQWNMPAADVDHIIDLLVDQSLRKSLKKSVSVQLPDQKSQTFYLPDSVKKSIKIYCVTKTAKQLSELEEVEMYALFQAICEDRGKTEQKKKIIRSIDHQTTRVIVSEEGKDKRVKLAIAETRKKPLWDFIVDYANASETRQNELLSDVRKMIVLYVCGVETYKNINSLGDLHLRDWEGYGILPKQLFVPIENCCMEKHEDVTAEEIRKANISHYRNAAEVVTDEQSKFWLSHFENVIETLFAKRSKRRLERLESLYLCEYLWKDFFSYVATKYIDLGKGVYHFTMKTNLSKEKVKDGVRYGVVDPRYNHGITSFDYERIKAAEELDRDIATYTTFATNVFAKAVVRDEYRTKKDNNSDVLQYKDELFTDSKVIRENAKKRLLQYWGGESRQKAVLDDLDLGSMCVAIRNCLSVIRNSSVHYTAKNKHRDVAANPAVLRLFERDFADIKNIYAAKYYSNNVWMFYGTDEISRLMNLLYQDNTTVREAQVPSFNSILKRKDIVEMIERTIKKNSVKKIKELDDIEKYRASMYFVFKEIYYHAFLLQPDLKQKFIGYIETMEKGTGKNNERAANDFRARVLKINTEETSFGELCQMIMTEYNLQNQGKKQIESKDRQEWNKGNGRGDSYKHFPLLLHKALKEMFISYIKGQENLAFLREPRLTGSEIQLDTFQSKIADIRLYTVVKEKVEERNELLDWYVLAHFLMPKQLNHLLGDLKNYIQFTDNIDKRAGSVRNNKSVDTQSRAKHYMDVIRVLDFTMQYIGRVSNVITDYFIDEDEYATFLAQFVDFAGDGENTATIAMKAFCQERIQTRNGSQMIGLYCDGANPILNRNIAYAKMYSNDEILSQIYEKVTRTEIRNYYKQQENLQTVFEGGICKNQNQQKELCTFQQLKNHIELTEIAIYTDILNDFMAQFISWAYLRERDLMYFQLGIHYIRLFYNSKPLEKKYRQLHGEDIHIEEGALLYQIVAMYTHDLPIYAVDETGNARRAKKQGTSGGSIMGFVQEYCEEDIDTSPTYLHGMSLFETVRLHDEISRFRNDIAHMRYMSSTKESIMDIVSEIYRSFFIYDTKLKKSVSFIFKNILMRYAIVTDLIFSHQKQGTGNLIRIGKVTSDKYMYKLPDDEKKTVNIEVRNQKFLTQLQALLEFKKEK